MGASKSNDKEIWFKRTFANGDRGGYLRYKKEYVYKIRVSQEFNKSKGYPPMYSLQEAPFWVTPYMYFKKNKWQFWSLLIAIIGGVTGAVVAYFMGTKK